MTSARIAVKLLGASVLSLGIACGLAFGLSAAGVSGVAHADDDDYSAWDDDYDYGPANEIYASPDTYADPAPELVPWGQWINEGMASAPQVDTTVQQSR